MGGQSPHRVGQEGQSSTPLHTISASPHLSDFYLIPPCFRFYLNCCFVKRQLVVVNAKDLEDAQ